MANTKEKGFKAGLYAVAAGLVVAVVLVALTVFAFTTRYTAFSPEKVAQAYVDGIVQTGDGYNAYKVTLLSKNHKYGDFIRNVYMAPFVNDGDDVKQAAFVGTGSAEEAEAIDKVYSTMYEYFYKLIEDGMDDYDTIFTKYFSKLREVRKEVYKDDYMSTEFMFGAFEANVAAYGEYLTGTQRVFASDNKTVIKEQKEGLYQKLYGEPAEVEVFKLVDGKKTAVNETQNVYKLTTTTTSCEDFSVEDYKVAYNARITPIAESGKAMAEKYGLEMEIQDGKKTKDGPAVAMINSLKALDCTSEIEDVKLCTVEVKTQDDRVIAVQQLYVVKIGNSWYVDNTSVDTSGLYLNDVEY